MENLENTNENVYNIETILLNLKMLSQINANDKLYTEDGQIKIDTPTMMQGIYRWMNDFSKK